MISKSDSKFVNFEFTMLNPPFLILKLYSQIWIQRSKKFQVTHFYKNLNSGSGILDPLFLILKLYPQIWIQHPKKFRGTHFYINLNFGTAKYWIGYLDFRNCILRFGFNDFK